MSEEWREIPGYLGYEASTEGRIRSTDRLITTRTGIVKKMRGRILRPSTSVGYPFVVLARGNTRRVHSLVALTFHGPQPAGLYVCHADGDVENSRPSNLYYGTAKRNSEDRVRHGTDCRGERHPNAKLSDFQALEIRRRAIAGENQRLLAAEFGVTQSLVSEIKNMERWSHL